MSATESSRNTPGNTPKPRTNHQSAAMSAALLVRFQYSLESKTQFSRECLDHLKASLAPGQETTA